MQLKGVLFDLDGTLIDSVHDFLTISNDLRQERGLQPLSLETLAAKFAHGGDELYSYIFELPPDDPEYQQLKLRSHLLYAESCGQQASFYPGITELLDKLDSLNLPWGIVTNKITRLTTPLLEELGIKGRVYTLVCADTTQHVKPHPEPVLHALRELRIPPNEAVFIGDAKRDIDAGKAAGTRTIAAAFGYADPEEIYSWNADRVAYKATEIWPLLQQWL